MLTLTALLLANLALPSAQALGFHETMHLAFEKNLRTEANKLQIAAMRARTAAAWKRLLPTLSFSYSYANSRYSNFDGTQTTFGRSSTRGGSYSVSANLYNGGADYFAALAAESAQLAQEAQLNSTNAFIPNTKGAIANLVASSYFSILAQLSAVDFFNERLALLTDLLRVAQTTQDKRALQVQVPTSRHRVHCVR